VMEMDCFMCHLPGYDYVGRRNLLRTGKLGNLATVGAGLAADAGLPYGAENFGTTVAYDVNNPAFEFIGTGLDNTIKPIRLRANWADENLAGNPDSTNCAFCHMNEFSVDWKKRGDHWAPNGQYDFNYEVHYNIGCMGCHDRDTDDNLRWIGPSTEYSVMAPGSLGHDPAKGKYAQYSGLYNKNDDVQFKDCVDCHSGTTIGADYGAPNPDGAHAAAGLTAKIAQGANAMDGTMKVSHIDMMHCSTCHSRKINSYDWGNTGNPLIDATGDDHDGRLTDHESEYVAKPDMTDNTSLQWFNGKLRAVSPSATMFWRDKNDWPEGTLGGLDANFDGRPNGMDALLMTDVLAVNEAQDTTPNDGIDDSWDAITYDTHGVVTPADFATRITALSNYIDAKAGTGTPAIKFSLFHVNFMNQHAVSPAAYAWGSGSFNDPLDPSDDIAPDVPGTEYFCSDCHNSASNFYNGYVDTTGPSTLTFAPGTAQRVPFTKVNGFSQATDWHPNQFDKFAKRTIAIQISNVLADCDGDSLVGDCQTTRDVQKSENAYEATFMTTADFAPSYSSSAAIGFGGFEKGWQLWVEVQFAAETTVRSTTYAAGSTGSFIKAVSTNLTDVAGLISNLGTAMTGGSYGFTISAYDVPTAAGPDGELGTADDLNTGTNDGITITGLNGNLVRLKPGNAASFGLTSAAYKANPWTGIDGNDYTGRVAWTGYLDGITASGVGLGVDPQAVILQIGSVTEGDTVTLTPDVALNTEGSFTYSWKVGNVDVPVADQATGVASYTFDTAGTYNVYLSVIDEEGKLATASTTVVVEAPAPLADIYYVDPDQVMFQNLPASYTMLYINWGDGTTSRVTTLDNDGDELVPHSFISSPRKDMGTYYEYSVTVYVYDGRARVAVKVATVQVPK